MIMHITQDRYSEPSETTLKAQVNSILCTANWNQDPNVWTEWYTIIVIIPKMFASYIPIFTAWHPAEYFSPSIFGNNI